MRLIPLEDERRHRLLNWMARPEMEDLMGALRGHHALLADEIGRSIVERAAKNVDGHTQPTAAEVNKVSLASKYLTTIETIEAFRRDRSLLVRASSATTDA